ncbi:MAG: hypothetical protein AAFY28_03060 [Actinomycetota bacterium]
MADTPNGGAGDEGSDPTPIDTEIFTVEADSEGIGAGVQLPGSGSGGSGEAEPEAPRCERREATVGSVVTSTAGGELDPSLDPFEQASITYGTVTLLAVCERCDGGVWELIFVEQVDPLDLLPDAEQAARARLQVPSPNINPDPALGGFVNLGLWFAVEEPNPDPVVARAELSGVWAEASGTLRGIEVDPGTGDPVVVCDGVGVPIEAVDPSLESVEQGPCGYTYTQSSPEDSPFQMTVTNVYDLTWRTSDGRSGSLGEARRSVTFGYDVDEIQTVGGP